MSTTISKQTKRTVAAERPKQPSLTIPKTVSSPKVEKDCHDRVLQSVPVTPIPTSARHRPSRSSHQRSLASSISVAPRSAPAGDGQYERFLSRLQTSTPVGCKHPGRKAMGAASFASSSSLCSWSSSYSSTSLSPSRKARHDPNMLLLLRKQRAKAQNKTVMKGLGDMIEATLEAGEDMLLNLPYIEVRKVLEQKDHWEALKSEFSEDQKMPKELCEAVILGTKSTRYLLMMLHIELKSIVEIYQQPATNSCDIQARRKLNSCLAELLRRTAKPDTLTNT